MRRETPTKLRIKLDKIKDYLVNLSNTVPQNMKETFNFKGRKSPIIAAKVMEIMFEVDTIMYDPFMGAGSFIYAGMGKAKKIFGTELDNYTFSVVHMLMSKLDLIKLEEMFIKIKEDAYEDIMELYETTCCGEKNHIRKLLFDPARGREGYFNPLSNREIFKGRNIKLTDSCSICGNIDKRFDEDDYQKLSTIENMNRDRFPKVTYIANSRINITHATGADKYDALFTPRSQIALLILQDAINRLETSDEKKALEHILVTSLSLARTAMYGSSTDILYHIVQHKAQEMNVWSIFEKKYRNLLKFKEEYANREIGSCGSDVVIVGIDYARYIEENPDLKVDCIYTDFPYTDQVPYLERNQLYRIWLETFVGSEYALTPEMLNSEIVVTNAESRKEKNIDNYYHDIDRMFLLFNRILNENGLVFLTVKLGAASHLKTYVKIINLARKNGFEHEFQLGIEKNDPTLRKQAAFLKTFTKEMLVIFRKLPNNERYWYIGDENYEFLLVKELYFRLAGSDSPITLTSAVNIICDDLKYRYSYLAQKSDQLKIKDIIQHNFSVNAGHIQINDNHLYLDIEDSSDLFVKLYDLIPIFIRKLLTDKGRFVLEDIYFELINSLCDGNPWTIIQILEGADHQRDIENLILNYCKLDNGYYIERTDLIKPKEDAVDVSTMTGSDFEVLICELLKKDGYNSVLRRGGAGDLGVDIMAVKHKNEKELHYIFQCKRWAAKVGSDPIQRLFAERERMKLDYAVCVTTSSYTNDGKKIAKALNVETIDGKSLLSLLDKYFPGEYYNSLIQ